MQTILEALPLSPWMTVDTTPLSPHPSDPAIMYPPPWQRWARRRAAVIQVSPSR
jgi:hypothetical protein